MLCSHTPPRAAARHSAFFWPRSQYASCFSVLAWRTPPREWPELAKETARLLGALPPGSLMEMRLDALSVRSLFALANEGIEYVRRALGFPQELFLAPPGTGYAAARNAVICLREVLTDQVSRLGCARPRARMHAARTAARPRGHPTSGQARRKARGASA